MDNNNVFHIVSKAMSNPFKIIPLLTKLLSTLAKIPDEDIEDIYKKYPELKETVSKLKLLLL